MRGLSLSVLLTLLPSNSLRVRKRSTPSEQMASASATSMVRFLVFFACLVQLTSPRTLDLRSEHHQNETIAAERSFSRHLWNLRLARSHDLDDDDDLLMDDILRQDDDNGATNESNRNETGSKYFDLIRVRPYMFVTILLLVAAFIKILYNCSPLNHQAPESCVLIILGVCFGVAGSYLNDFFKTPVLTDDRFFFLFLPPIIMESAYDLNDKQFYRNMIAILLFAVVGTAINIVGIGLCLYATFTLIQAMMFTNGLIPTSEFFVFSTIIAAVDPVTVLSIFEELGINKTLHYIVFGESLFNDAVVVTVFSVVLDIATLPSDDYMVTSANAVFKFFYVIVVAILIGTFSGVVTCFLTKITKHAKVTEPLVVSVLAYGSYVFAELFHASGIVSLTVCGLIQTSYARYNITARSLLTLKNLVKTSSKISETMIFFFLGRVVVTGRHFWSSSFIIATIALITLWRLVSVYVCSLVANRWLIRSRPINLEEGTVMAFGGLRGAIAFSLANMLLTRQAIQNSQLFVTTTLFVVIFTVFVFGATTKPLVQLLRVERRARKELSTFEKLNSFLVERHIMSLIEELSGQRQVNYWMSHFEDFNNKYIRQYLIAGGQEAVERADISISINLHNTVESHSRELTVKKFDTLDGSKIFSKV